MLFVFLVFGYLLLVLQTTFFHLLPGWLGRPDLLLLLLIFIALYLEVRRGLLLVLLLSLAMDVFSGSHLGVYPLVYLALFTVIRLLCRNLAIQDSIHQVPLVMISYLGVTAALPLLITMLSAASVTSWSWPLVLQNVLILGVLCLPFFHLCRRLQLLLEQRPPLSWSLFQPRGANRYRY
ncbi:MAG: rod shape-determining protein MreD [Desulfurivibrio sp.]|nr:rod shape-determining protein MreD [Desulfurivibrio sp.]